MQRLLFALIAAVSLLFVNPGTTHAQSGGAVEPGHNPQAIDEPVETPHPSGVIAHAPADAVVIGPDQTVRDVSVNGRRLLVQGHVTHNVTAINSQVTITQTATVDGVVTVIGGSVENLAGNRIHVDRPHNLMGIGFHKSTLLPGQLDIIETTPSGATTRDRGVPPVSQRHDWLGAQFALLVLGLLGGLTASLLLPRATQNVAEQVAQYPKRSLWLGGAAAAVMLGILLVDALLLHLRGIQYLWAPVGILVAVAPLLILGFGWLSGMRYAGDLIARKLNRSCEGTLFGRIALGLGAFFLANIFLSTLSEGLGVLSFGVELLVALMGLGAVVAIATGKGGRRRV